MQWEAISVNKSNFSVRSLVLSAPKSHILISPFSVWSNSKFHCLGTDKQLDWTRQVRVKSERKINGLDLYFIKIV